MYSSRALEHTETTFPISRILNVIRIFQHDGAKPFTVIFTDAHFPSFEYLEILCGNIGYFLPQIVFYNRTNSSWDFEHKFMQVREQDIAFTSLLHIAPVFPTFSASINMHKQFWNKRKDRYIFFHENLNVLRQFLQLNEIQKIQHKIGITISRTFSPTHYLRSLSPRVGHSLNNRHIKCSGFLTSPYFFILDDGETFDGTNYRIVAEASKTFNFTFSTHVTSGYGTLLPNGTWIGLLGDIYYEDSEYEVAYSLGHDVILDGLIDYAACLDFVRLTFMTRHPLPQVMNMWGLLLPFQPCVWYAILGIFCALVATIYSVFVCEDRRSQWKKKNYIDAVISKDDGLCNSDYFCRSFVLIYCITLEQTVTIPNKNIKLQLLVAVWLFFILNMGTGYKSNLVSYLSIPEKGSIPRDMEQLATSTYGVTLNFFGIVELIFFNTSDLNTVKGINRRMLLDSSTETCVENAMLNIDQVCLGWDQSLLLNAASQFTIQPQMDPLFKSADDLTQIPLSMGFRKDSKFLDAFTSISYSFLETGIYSRWKNEIHCLFKRIGVRRMEKIRGNNPSVYKIVDEILKSLDGQVPVKAFHVENVMLAFVILGSGLAWAKLIFLCELICLRRLK
ncbi:Glutamate receptor [Folsomia candida]|uniref:Glutamate receptor n=1 Tax=Folsomia candida TaxID=158441 RepID=A0A226EKS2_FOLCA|nr:Glutamate receptor [Folsomia candida]